MNPDTIYSRRGRTRLRYMAARHPDLSLPQLAEAVWADLGWPLVPLSDIRLILRGRSLTNPAHTMESIPIEAIQTVGRILSMGGGIRAAARAAGVSVDTVRELDSFTGIRADRRSAILAHAEKAVAEGVSVRVLAMQLGLSRGSAHRLMRKVSR
jgi:hypothetical protein